MSLEKQITDLADSPEENIEFGVFCFVGAIKGWCELWKGLKNEGCYFDKGVIKGARGQTKLRRPKYTPYRICETKKS